MDVPFSLVFGVQGRPSEELEFDNEASASMPHDANVAHVFPMRGTDLSNPLFEPLSD